MKRLLLILFASSLVLAAGAQERFSELRPKDPRAMAMGDTTQALSSGYQAFFGNPAAFADGKGELSLLDASAWLYISPTTSNIAALQTAMGQSGPDIVTTLNDLITTNGIGGGGAFGIGYAGGGLGIGLTTVVDSYVWGKNALGAEGTLDAQVSLTLGVAFPLPLFGLDLSVGGGLRPFLRMTGPISSTQLTSLMTGGSIDAAIGGAAVDVGFGLAGDVGAKLNLGKRLTIGLSVRDIGTEQRFSPSTFGEVLDYLGQGDLPPSDSHVTYLMYPDITLGASFRPIVGPLSGLVDLLFLVELQDPVGVIQEQKTVLQLLHGGAEARFLGGLFSLRGGVNQGYLSMGIGMELLALKLDVGLFTEELGFRPGDRPRTGVAAQLALRF